MKRPSKFSREALVEAKLLSQRTDAQLWKMLRVGCDCGGYYSKRNGRRGRFYACHLCENTMQRDQHIILKAGTVLLAMIERAEAVPAWSLYLGRDPGTNALRTIKSSDVPPLADLWPQFRDTLNDRST